MLQQSKFAKRVMAETPSLWFKNSFSVWWIAIFTSLNAHVLEEWKDRSWVLYKRVRKAVLVAPRNSQFSSEMLRPRWAAALSIILTVENRENSGNVCLSLKIREISEYFFILYPKSQGELRPRGRIRSYKQWRGFLLATRKPTMTFAA